MLVLSSSEDAQRASSVWKNFSATLGERTWNDPLFSVGQVDCKAHASGASPAYIAPPALAALAGFWFVQLLDSVFSVTSSIPATYECSAMNFSLVGDHQKFLSGFSFLFLFLSLLQCRRTLPYLLTLFAQCTWFTKMAASALETRTSLYSNVSFYGLSTASHHPNLSFLSIVGAAAAGSSISGNQPRQFHAITASCAIGIVCMLFTIWKCRVKREKRVYP